MLKGLKGIAGKEIEHEWITKPSDIKRIIEAGKGGTSAGDNRAINVWKDDLGFIRCEAQVYLKTVDEQKYDDISDAKIWIKEWLVKIN